MREAAQEIESFFLKGVEKGGVKKGDFVLLGVSGGADSLSLFSLFQQFQKRLGIQMGVAHLNHGLREEAAVEEEKVRRLCEEGSVLYDSATVATRDVALTHHLSLEEAARGLRYAFFLSICEKWKANHVAVAHTADDQAETVLMRFLRGAGIEGLSGIPQRRMLSSMQVSSFSSIFQSRYEVGLIRPLLGVWRSQIEAYLEWKGLIPSEDPSNQDKAFTRNRIRHEAIPFLTSFNPNLKERLVRAAEIFDRQSVFYEGLIEKEKKGLFLKQTDGEIILKRSKLLKWPEFLQWFVLKEVHASLAPPGASLQSVHFEAIVTQLGKEKGWVLHLPGPVYLKRARDELVFSLSPSPFAVL